MREQAQERGPQREPAQHPHRPAAMPKVSQALPPLGAAAIATTAALDLQRLAGNRAVAAGGRPDQPSGRCNASRSRRPHRTRRSTTSRALASTARRSLRRRRLVRHGPQRRRRRHRHDPDPVPEPDPQRRGPKTAASPATDPALGTLISKPTEIPANDPDDRRNWCQNIVKEQVKPWNGKLTLVGEEVNVFSKNTPKRLPVTFDSVAVFGLDEKHDQRIIVHPKSVPANAKGGNPIDAGNYYLNKGDYSDDDKVIAAHEYGHLLGIDDEYSQSNEMLNALLHQAAPKNAPSAKAALDKKTIEQMVLASLKQPLLDQLKSTLPAVTDAFRAKRATVKAKMAAAARSGIVDAAVRTELEKQLTATSDPRLGPSVPRVVAFETTKNFSNITVSGEGVEAGFDATKMAARSCRCTRRLSAIRRAARSTWPGSGKTTIIVHGSVPAMTAAGGAQQANAADAAAGTMGSAGGPAPCSGCR